MCVVNNSTYFTACVSDVVFLSILNIRRKFIGVEEHNFFKMAGSMLSRHNI